MAALAIEISDGDSTASSDAAGDDTNIIPKSHGKRKPSADFEEKVVWTDDDGDDQVNRKPAQSRPAKRRATAKGKGKNTAEGRGRPPKTAGRSLKAGVDGEDIKDEYAESKIPEYLRARRRRFDSDRERLRDAGLKLPPDYADLDFSDDDDMARLAERPKFDEASGIRPCRPYKDIELECSAGVVPASVAQYLRDYQVDGVKFLHQHFVYQTGCILGDDMGLGKTVQVAAFLTAAFGKTGDERDAKRMRKMRRAGDSWYPRVFIVCPTSLIQNWKNELNKWGFWHVDIYHGPDRDDVLRSAKAGRVEIMITTYGTYRFSHEAVNAVEWDCVVADECHQLKDRTSQVTQAMDGVNSLCRIGLTGTAIQNNYTELWTLLNWTNPRYFGTLAEWNNTISKPLTNGQAHTATLKELSLARTTAKKLVQNLLPGFFLRRLKSLIAHQLPKKSDKVVFCPLTDIQIEAYQNFLDGYTINIVRTVQDPCLCGSGRKRGWCCYKTLQDGRPWMSVVFPSIITLQKIANHLTMLIPSTGDPTDKQKSELNALQVCLPNDWEELYKKRDSIISLANPEYCGKWKVLRKLLRFWHENGDKVLVFSHSVRLLRILQHLFNNTSYNVSFLDGSLKSEERQSVVDNFNTDPAQFVFLISTKAGGMGLNITSANKVVIFDPHWNPSWDLQAQDRAYRIGQVRDVDVFRLVSAGTIEEIVYARQIYKQQQANIGYTASEERRYFKGVQKDSNRKGEIFGLNNLFSFQADQVVLRDIMNKTNIAEAKAGVRLADIEADEEDPVFIKKEGQDDAGGLKQIVEIVTAEDQEEFVKKRKEKHPTSDLEVAAILASSGVEYTHENSEVIGTSKIEARLSRRAEMVANADSQDPEGNNVLFADSQANSVPTRGSKTLMMHEVFNPPEEVRRRQFCSMAKEFGFNDATKFALVVESWTQEQRRNCLDQFYKRRQMKILDKEIEKM
ncbi:P-loop containing nucleoside triphosphate hydrolase protein, partial [Podospora didyma]